MHTAVVVPPRVSLYATTSVVTFFVVLVLSIGDVPRVRNDAGRARDEFSRIHERLRKELTMIRRPQPEAHSPLQLECGASGDEEGFWSAATQAIEHVHAKSIDEFVAATRILIARMRHVDASIQATVDRIDSSRAAVFVAYRCGSYSAGGRLFLLTHADANKWSVADRIVLPAGEAASVVAHEGERYVLQSTTIMPRIDVSTITLVRAYPSQWQRMYTRENVTDLKTKRTNPGVVATWSEKSKWFEMPLGDRPLAFEATLALRSDRSRSPAFIRSTTPWLDGLEAFCDEHFEDPSASCNGRILRVRVTGEVADIRVSSTTGCTTSPWHGVPQRFDETELVFKLKHVGRRWLVIAAHTADSRHVPCLWLEALHGG